MTTPRLYTIEEAAPLLGMAKDTLRDRVNPRAGDRFVAHIRVHGRKGVRFTDEHIRSYLASREQVAVPGPGATPQASPALSRLAGITLAGRR